MAKAAASTLFSHSCSFGPRASSACRLSGLHFSGSLRGTVGAVAVVRRTVSLKAVAASAAGSARGGASDPELRLVFELATDGELAALDEILFGTSYFSPFLKSMGSRPDSDYIFDVDDVEAREILMSNLESRFFYLAADAHAVIRGRRPSYRSVLLGIRRKLLVPCSSRLATEDLEVEIFLHLLNNYSSSQQGPSIFPWRETRSYKDHANLEAGLNSWKVLADSALKEGVKGLQHVFLKGGGLLTLEKIYEQLAKRLSGRLLLEVANYEIKNEIIKWGGQLAAVNLEARAGLLIARQGLGLAAKRYLGLRSLMMILGPLMWGTFLADVVIQMLGTDYARILRAVYAFAQIRLMRTYRVASFED